MISDDITNSLHSLIGLLLDKPECFRLDTTSGDHSLIIMIYTDKTDISKVVGKMGRNINSLKTLASAAGAKNGLRVSLVINE